MTPPSNLDTATAEDWASEDWASEGLHRLDAALHDYRGRIAVVASFGADSAVLLALVAERDPAVPVLFLDTAKHFPETLAYRRSLVAGLGLADVRTIRPTPAELASRDPSGALHAFDADACCALRKVEPLERALAPFGAWVTGRKRTQAASRAGLRLSERVDGRLKVNPLAVWTAPMIEAEMHRRGLPRHPLVARGFPSIGCAPCTHAVLPGADPRSGRWAALAKTECGIHRPGHAGGAGPALRRGPDSRAPEHAPPPCPEASHAPCDPHASRRPGAVLPGMGADHAAERQLRPHA